MKPAIPASDDSLEIPPGRTGANRHKDSGRTRRTWLSPQSGALILFLDNIYFGANVTTGMIATPLVCTLAFLTTSTGVFFIQKVHCRDSFRASVGKAFCAGVVAAIPTSIVGTAVGSLVLLTSGLHVLSRS